jgi:acyl carrier protein
MHNQRAGPTGSHEGARSGQSSGLEGEDFEVVVEFERLDSYAGGSRMTGHDGRAIKGGHAVGTEGDIEPASGETDGDRIEALAHADPALGVHPTNRKLFVIAELDLQVDPSPRNVKDLVARIQDRIRSRIGITPRSVALVQRGHLPMTSSGKVQRSVVRDFLLQGSIELLPDLSSNPALDEIGEHRMDHRDDSLSPTLTFAEYATTVLDELEIFGIDSPTPDDRLYEDFGLDSLQTFELVVTTERLAGLNAPPQRCACNFSLGEAHRSYEFCAGLA